MWLFKNKKTLPKGSISYATETEERQSKSAVSALVVEIMVLLLVISGIVAALNYLGILSITSLLNIPKPVQFTNPVEKGRDLSRVTPTIARVNAQLEVVSDIPKNKFILKRKDDVIQLLKEWDVYGVSYIDPRFGSTNGTPLEKIIVHLTDKEQPAFGQADKNGIYASSGYKFSDRALDAYIYIAPRILNGETANYVANQKALLSLRVVKQRADTGQKYMENLKIITEIVDKAKIDNNYFFTIE